MNSIVLTSDCGRIQGFKEIPLNPIDDWGNTKSAAKTAIISHLNENYADASPGSQAYTADGQLILIKAPSGDWTEFCGGE